MPKARNKHIFLVHFELVSLRVNIFYFIFGERFIRFSTLWLAGSERFNCGKIFAVFLGHFLHSAMVSTFKAVYEPYLMRISPAKN